MGFFENVVSRITGGALRRREYRYQRDQMLHQKAGIEGEQAFRLTEDPREQAFQKSSMFARGLGKSSINEQEGTRLTEMQGRRNAALARGHKLAVDGLALLKKKKRAQNQLMWASTIDDVIGLWGGAASSMNSLGIGGGGGGGGGGGNETSYSGGGYGGGYNA